MLLALPTPMAIKLLLAAIAFAMPQQAAEISSATADSFTPDFEAHVTRHGWSYRQGTPDFTKRRKLFRRPIEEASVQNDSDHTENELNKWKGWRRGSRVSAAADLAGHSRFLELEAGHSTEAPQTFDWHKSRPKRIVTSERVQPQQRVYVSSLNLGYLAICASNFAYGDFGGNTLLIVATLMLVVLLGFCACCCKGGRSPFYFTDMAKFLAGRPYHEVLAIRSNDGGKTAKFPGPGATSIITYEQVATEMEAMPTRWANDEIYRGLDLGYIRLNPYFWPDTPFALSVSKEIHAWLRPILDQLLGSNGNWSADMIAQSAREYFAYKKQEGKAFKIQADVKMWTQIVLHRVHLDIEMTPEEAARFTDVQSKTLLGITLPQCATNYLGSIVGTSESLAFKEECCKLYSEKLRPKYPDKSDHDIRILASALLDSLMFAGGLSVAMVISCAMATVYSRNSPCKEPLKPLETDKIPLIIWETIRYYPAVVGFPWYDGPDQKERTILSLSSALKDPRAWGGDFGEFKLRDLATHHRLSLAWADKAIHPDRPQYNRKCPAKDLSLAMAIGFLEEWAKVQDSWSLPNDDIEIDTATPFTDLWEFLPK